MKVKIAALSVVAGLVLATPGIVAHHSFAAEFDANKPLNLKGVVTKIEWSNPHTYFYMDVTGTDGKVVNWGMEMGSPNGLMRQGWTRNTLHVGDEVTVEGAQAKDASNNGFGQKVTFPDGRNVFTAPPPSQQ